MTSNLSQSFQTPLTIQQDEPLLRDYWKDLFRYEAKSHPSFSMVMPPPNITGDLTIGHVLNNTLQDVLIRWHRMCGEEVCWVPGIDHASIATESKVLQFLKSQGISKESLTKETFLKEVLKWKETYGSRIIDDLKFLGISCDWDRLTYTLDPSYNEKVFQGIIDLYHKGFIYKDYRIVNWCPVSQSVISDEEVNHQTQSGNLWYIRYPLILGDADSPFIVVATTRPETIFGDMAIAVNPEDPRYQKWIGKHCFVPLINKKIPILADSMVESSFGTGAVKITPAHDPNDFHVAQRHKLPFLNILNKDASLNENVPSEYQGLDRFDARKKVISSLEEIVLLDKIEPYTLNVGISERGYVPIEYRLSDQWFMKMDSLAQKALNATRQGDLSFFPAYHLKTWEHWLSNIQDWCISRQLWWGHQLPFYTCEKCHHIHARMPSDATLPCEKCHHPVCIQDPDVLDTWASSWLFPQAIEDADIIYPTHTLVTAPEIIFFWVARMVMAGLEFKQELPFKHVYFTPIVRDHLGRKMSKSLGNSPKIKDLIHEYGTDALRFAVVNHTNPGQDIAWKNQHCQVGSHFAHKIWNCGRFFEFIFQKNQWTWKPAPLSSFSHPLSLWFLKKLSVVFDECHKYIKEYEFSKYTQTLYEFTWMEFCDWYIEFIKHETDEQLFQESAQIFEMILLMLNPVMPFITEKIWQCLTSRTQSISLEKFPSFPSLLSPHDQILTSLQECISEVRTLKSQFQIKSGYHLKTSLNPLSPYEKQLLSLTGASTVDWNSTPSKNDLTLPLSNHQSISISQENLVDMTKELKRLSSRKEKLEIIIEKTILRINSPEFAQNAPPAVVAGAEAELLKTQQEYKTILKNLEILQS